MKNISALLFLNCFFAFALSAQTIAPDVSFGNNGEAGHKLAFGTERFVCAAPAGNGGIYAGGNLQRKTQDFQIMKILASGAKDPSFGNNGSMAFDNQEGTDNLGGIAVQTDGNILLAGYFQKSGSTRGFLMRLTSNGQPDNNFGNGGNIVFDVNGGTGAYTSVSAIRLQSDGKILLTGTTLASSQYKAFVQRRNADGTPDATFGTGGTSQILFTSGQYSFGQDIATGPDGSIAILGQVYTNRYLIGLARITSSGQADASFGTAGVKTYSASNGQQYPTRIFAMADGKYRIIGYCNSSTAGYKILQARFMADGSTESTFGGNTGYILYSGSADYNGAYAAEMLSDGSLLVGGEMLLQNYYQAMSLKIDDSGNPAAGYGSLGFATYNPTPTENFILSIIENASGSAILLGGQYRAQENSVLSATFGIQSANGQLRADFGSQGRATFKESRASVQGRSLKKLSDGKYLCTGTMQNNNKDLFIARFLPNGKIDSSYQNNGLTIRNLNGPDEHVGQLTLPNGQEMILFRSGEQSLTFTGLGTFSGPIEYGLYAFNPANGFSLGTSGTDVVSTGEFQEPVAAAIDHKGRIMVAVKGQQPSKNTGYIVRWLGPDFVDQSYGTAGQRVLYSNMFNNEQEVRDIKTDSEGNLYIMQYMYMQTNNLGGMYIVKRDSNYVPVNAYGSFGECKVFDNSLSLFDPIAMTMNNGAIYVHGKKAGVSTIARVSASGEFQGFISLVDFGTIGKVLFLPDGSAFVTGTGTDGFFRMVKINSAGTVDASFNGTGFFSGNLFSAATRVYDAIMENDGASFTILAETPASPEGSMLSLLRLSFLTGREAQINTLSSEPLLFPNPCLDRLELRNFSHSPLRFRIYNANGSLVQPEGILTGNQVPDIESLSPGGYFILLDSGREKKQLRFVKE